MSRLVELNRGPLVGARRARSASSPAAPAGATVLDVRPASTTTSPATSTERSTCPSPGSSFATKAGFVLDPERPDRRAGGDARPRPSARSRGLRSVGFLDLEGYVLGGGPGADRAGRPRRARPAARGGRRADRRPRARRARRRLHRRQPQHPVPAARASPAPTCRPTGPSSRSARAARAPAIAASILAAKGIDARPVLDGGIAAWAARGGQIVEFRRCG